MFLAAATACGLQSRPFRRDKISVDKDGDFQITGLPESIYVLRADAYLKGEPKETRALYASASTRLSIPTKMDDQQVGLNPLMLSIKKRKKNDQAAISNRFSTSKTHFHVVSKVVNSTQRRIFSNDAREHGDVHRWFKPQVVSVSGHIDRS